MMERFTTQKHSSLLDQFVSYDENEVLWIGLMNRIGIRPLLVDYCFELCGGIFTDQCHKNFTAVTYGRKDSLFR
jgi:hypothetical protein